MYYLEFTNIDKDNQYETLSIAVESYMVKGKMYPAKKGMGPTYCPQTIVVFDPDGCREKGITYYLGEKNILDPQVYSRRTYQRCTIMDKDNRIIVSYDGEMSKAASSALDLMDRVESSGLVDNKTG